MGPAPNFRSRQKLNLDIRWKQRFQNFERAFVFLQKAVAQGNFNDLEAAGLVQAFEFAFELSWKTLKDYLELQGFALASPRDVLKQAFQSGLIEDGHLWIEMLNNRNRLSHAYDEKHAKEAIHLITKAYFPGLSQVYKTLQGLS